MTQGCNHSLQHVSQERGRLSASLALPALDARNDKNPFVHCGPVVVWYLFSAVPLIISPDVFCLVHNSPSSGTV